MSETRVCRKCGIEKTIDQFNKVKKGCVVYRERRCKSCVSEYNKAYRENNKEKINVYLAANRVERAKKKKEYRRKSQEKVLAYKKKYKEENAEKINLARKIYRDGAGREVIRKWNQGNKEKLANYQRNVRKDVRLSYVRLVLGIKKESLVPIDLLLVKQMQIKINRLLKEKQ